jgi:hypothetical protein
MRHRIDQGVVCFGLFGEVLMIDRTKHGDVTNGVNKQTLRRHCRPLPERP